MSEAIDWTVIAERLGTITWTDGGRNERGGTETAFEALVEIVGEKAWRDAVDFYVAWLPGAEVVRSVLRLLQPPAAMERCLETIRNTDDEQRASDAANLLVSAADRRVLHWLPELLAHETIGVRTWAVCTIDQLWIMREEISREEAMPLLEMALRDPHESVRAQARQVLDLADSK